MTQQTNWLPGLIVLAVCFVAAALFLLLTRRKEAPSSEPRDGTLEDLERRAQSLIEQLKELAAERHNLAPEHYAAERSRLEQEAAAALRARDEYLQQRKAGSSAPAPLTAPAPTGFLAHSPQLKGALWGAGIVLFFGTLGYLIVAEQRPRTEDQAATGKVPPGMPAGNMAPQEDPALARARERLRANPGDLETAALLSHELIRGQHFEEATRVTHRGLAVDPFNVELRVHRGVLRAMQGDLQGAEQELVQLVDTYPDAQEALIFLGAIALKQQDKRKALEHFERFAVEVPSQMQPPQLLQTIAQLRQELGTAAR